MKTINLKAIIEKYCYITKDHDLDEMPDVYSSLNSVHYAIQEACRQTLELAADNAKTENKSEKINLPHGAKYNTVSTIVDKQSILDTINQIK